MNNFNHKLLICAAIITSLSSSFKIEAMFAGALLRSVSSISRVGHQQTFVGNPQLRRATPIVSNPFRSNHQQSYNSEQNKYHVSRKTGTTACIGLLALGAIPLIAQQLNDDSQKEEKSTSPIKKDVNPKLAKTLRQDFNKEKRQMALLGASSICDKVGVASALESLRGEERDSRTDQRALMATIKKCFTHANGPDIIDHLADHGVDLNDPVKGMRPLAEVSALAAEQCSFEMLDKMLARGADPALKNQLDPNGPALSTLEMYTILLHRPDSPPCNQKVVDRLRAASGYQFRLKPLESQDNSEYLKFLFGQKK